MCAQASGRAPLSVNAIAASSSAAKRAVSLSGAIDVRILVNSRARAGRPNATEPSAAAIRPERPRPVRVRGGGPPRGAPGGEGRGGGGAPPVPAAGALGRVRVGRGERGEPSLPRVGTGGGSPPAIVG